MVWDSWGGVWKLKWILLFSPSFQLLLAAPDYTKSVNGKNDVLILRVLTFSHGRGGVGLYVCR